MLWDESFQSWQSLGISAQPAAVMFAPDGTIITGWLGPFPENEVIELAAEYPAEILGQNGKGPRLSAGSL